MDGFLWEEISEGQEVTPLIKKSSYMQLFMFSAVTWNRHLIHYNSEFARHDGLPNVATHRALIGNILAQMLSNWVGEAGSVAKIEWSVRNTAIPGDTLTFKGKVLDKRDEGANRFTDCEIWVENQRGDLIAKGKGIVVFYQ